MDSLREVSFHGSLFWMLITTNLVIQTVSWGVVAYLPAFMMHSYPIAASDTVLPLALVGIGVLDASLQGGLIAGLANRKIISICTLLSAGGLSWRRGDCRCADDTHIAGGAGG